MALLTGLSFGFFTDEGLTIAFSGNLIDLVHQTDFSDNPQDVQLWFGSNAATSTLQATSNPGVDNIVLTPTNTLPEWEASNAYSLGDRVTPTTPNGYVYEVTTAGTSDSSEPTWPTTPIGDTVTDGTVEWTLISTQHAITEIKLATTEAGLDSATGGAALSLGNTLTSGVDNAVEVNIRVTNAVSIIGNNAGEPDLGIYINSVTETF